MKNLKIFALNGSESFGVEVAEYLGLPLSKHEEYYFDDGEVYCASLENVRGREVFVIQSLYSDNKESVNDKMMKMLTFLGSLHDASAERITLVVPYLGARQDRKTTSRAPITTKYITRLLESMWTKRILTLDIHSPTAIQNAYTIPCDLLEARNIFASSIVEILNGRDARKLIVLSPDTGGLGRAAIFRNVLSDLLRTEVGIACMYKTHRGRDIKGHGIMGDVAGKSLIIYDDMISSGKTILECCEISKRRDADEVLAVCATHGLFVGKANEYLCTPFLKNIIITDTIKPFRLTNKDIVRKLKIVKTTKLFAEAIRRISSDESISDLINLIN